MGRYLNPGNSLFQEALNSDIYVDKTGLIRFVNGCLNTKNKFMCVSRPRRFGKSMAMEMLAAYYDRSCDSEEMFHGLEISKNEIEFQKGRNKYDVLLVDMQGLTSEVLYDKNVEEESVAFERNLPGMGKAELAKTKHPILAAMQRRLIRDIRRNEEYAEYISGDEESLADALLAVHQNTGNRFVILIDEWDSVFRNCTEDVVLQDKYIDFLRSMFKNTSVAPAFALVYMTGILPIKRYNTQSAMNNFTEYTFLNPRKLAEYSGFTEAETKCLCREYKINFDEMSAWYNGYFFKNSGRIYNPRSVVEAIRNEEFDNYWTATGVYESVKTPIEMNFEGLKEDIITLLGNGRCEVDVRKFNNDMVTFHSKDDVFTLLIHLGYLGYDSERKEIYIPNKEIRDEFVHAIEGDKWKKTYEAIASSRKLLEATLAMDEKTVAECIEKVHEDNTSILNYNNENALSCVIQIAYYAAQDDYMFLREMPAGKGVADVVFLPRGRVEKPAVVLELKWDRTAGTAIDQIREKRYNGKLNEYYGEVLLVGISYDKDGAEAKRHFCKIEKVRK